MIEGVTVGALTAFFTAVWNGAAGEMGKQLLLTTGAQVRRTLGRQAPPLPAGAADGEALARAVHARLGEDGRLAGEWALLLRTLPGTAPVLRPGPGLPPATRDFVDRERARRQLTREATRPAGGRPRVALLHGPPGIGTSATALYWGAEQFERYPDGRFHLDLRGAAGQHGPEPAAVLASLLRKMGVAQLPAGEVRRQELYRELTAGRRALIVVDHASSAAQVRALVPATPEVFLLVVASGPPFALEAERIAVPPLSRSDAVKMLRRAVGTEEVARVKRQLPAVLEHCAGNAFALKAAASRLLSEESPVPDEGESTMAQHPVRGVVQAACRALRPEAARLCRLTALGDWPLIDARLAGWADGTARAEAGAMLEEAVERQLLDPAGDGRYRFRPEVRRCLEESAGPEHGIAECAAAVSRTLDGLLDRALHAAHATLPQSWRTEPAPGPHEPFPDETAGLQALVHDRENLVRAVLVADAYQHHETALRLARALWPLQLKAGHRDEVLPALRLAARRAVEQYPGSRTAGALQFQLAHCLGELERWEEAEEAARRAVDAEHTAGHTRGEASSVELLGLLRLYELRPEEAYERFIEAERIYRRIAPGEEGAEDLPRALALIERHQGRALRGMAEWDRARARLEAARDSFAALGDAYNRARTLTDLAETLLLAGDTAGARTEIARAEQLLSPEAAVHLEYLARLRLRCEEAE